MTKSERERKYHFDTPSEMKGPINSTAALARISTVDRDAIQRRLQKMESSRSTDEIDKAIDKAAEWIHRYLVSDALGKVPLPTSQSQERSRERFETATSSLLKAMDSADRETKKRIYLFFAKSNNVAVTDEWGYGRSEYKRMRLNVELLALASKKSLRRNGKRSQARAHTFLVYRLAKIWTKATGQPFTTSPDGSRRPYTARDFINELLTAASRTATTEGIELLEKLLDRTKKTKEGPQLILNSVLTTAMSAAYRGIDRVRSDRRRDSDRDKSDSNARRRDSDES